MDDPLKLSHFMLVLMGEYKLMVTLVILSYAIIAGSYRMQRGSEMNIDFFFSFVIYFASI